MKIKRGSSQELDQADGEQAAPRKNMRKLPRCMDWIVVDRKKMNKHKEKKAPEQKPSSSPDPDAPVAVKASSDTGPPVPPVTAPPVAPQAGNPAAVTDVVWHAEGPGDSGRPEGEDERRSA